MINDGSNFKIVSSGYGAFSVQDCTVDNAQALLECNLSNLDAHIVEAADAIRDKTGYVVNTSSVVGALQELLSADIGQDLPKVTRMIHGKPAEGQTIKTIVFEDQHLIKLMVWAKANGVARNNLKELTSRAGYKLEEMNPMSFFLFDGIYKRAGEKKLIFLEDETIEAIEELAILKKNKWKATAKESGVVQRYLTFISNNLLGRDEKLDLGTYLSSDE